LKQCWSSGNDAREIDVGTIDCFQGAEYDIVLLVTARNLSDKNTLLDNTRSVNVALTRARRHIFLFADCKALKQSPMWNKIIDFPEKKDKKGHYRHDEIKGVMDKVESRMKRASKKRMKKKQPVLSSESNSPPPTWDYECVREQENTKRQRREERDNEKRQRIKEIGGWPAFDEDMAKLGESYGRMAREGKTFLATLSDDSDSE
jgi:hypothetical protein